MHPRGRHRAYTIEEYVLHEEYANVRHEFLDGQIYLMAGGIDCALDVDAVYSDPLTRP